jgi:predicted secreted protein
MSVVTGILLYVIIWWVVLFMVLPVGARPPEDPQPGNAPGAPEKPMLGRKALATTVIAAAVWAGVYWVITSGVLDLRGAIEPPG